MKNPMKGWIRLLALVGALAAGVTVWSGSPVVADAQDGEQSAQQAEGVVNLNTATIDELTRLPGVGPSKAQAIVDLRDSRGPFRRVEQVLFVRGIGRATFRRLRPMLTVEGDTTLGAQD